jgi:alkylhydroperoxidase family enzyme
LTVSESETSGKAAMTRIHPVNPPYDNATREQLDSMMPPGAEPILLFRTFAKNLPMTAAMGSWGRYELSANLSLTMRDREILIDRTCARCGCEYEWGVHVAFFAQRVHLSRDQVTSITHGGPNDGCWTDDRDRLLIRVADALHDTATTDDDLHNALTAEFTDNELLDLYLLCGWYHAISYTANAAHIDLEPGTPRFSDYPNPTDASKAAPSAPRSISSPCVTRRHSTD